jgi:hypothetical protein
MVVRLEDFMRRRSKIEQVVRWRDIEHAPGLAEASGSCSGTRERRAQAIWNGAAGGGRQFRIGP